MIHYSLDATEINFNRQSLTTREFISHERNNVEDSNSFKLNEGLSRPNSSRLSFSGENYNQRTQDLI